MQEWEYTLRGEYILQIRRNNIITNCVNLPVRAVVSNNRLGACDLGL